MNTEPVDIQTTITTNVNVDADFSAAVTEIGLNYIQLYSEPKFLGCILFAFLAAQLVNVLVRGYFPNTRNITRALAAWSTHLVVGGFFAHKFLSHLPDNEFFLYFTGVNSFMLYYILIWVSTKWFKWPQVASWLTLRKAEINESGNIEFGETVQFLAKDLNKP